MAVGSGVKIDRFIDGHFPTVLGKRDKFVTKKIYLVIQQSLVLELGFR